MKKEACMYVAKSCGKVPFGASTFIGRDCTPPTSTYQNDPFWPWMNAEHIFLLSSDKEEVENDAETNTEGGCQGHKTQAPH